MGGRCSWIVGTMLIFLACGRYAAADPPPALRLPDGAESHIVPLTRGGDYLFVRCSINGEDAGWFMVDTGANRLVVDTAVARRLKLPSVGAAAPIAGAGTRPVDATVYEAKQVEFGGMTTGSRLVTAVTLGNLPMLGEKLAGVIGTDVLRELPFSLDLRAATLTFHAPGKPLAAATADATPARVRKTNGRPAFWGEVEGRGGWFMFDSGSNGSFNLYHPFTNLNRDILTGKHPMRQVSVGVGGVSTARSARFDAFTIAGHEFGPRSGEYHDAPATGDDDYERTCAGSVGTSLFADARLTFDLAHPSAWVEWHAPEDVPAYLRRIQAELKSDLFGTPSLIRATGDARYDAARALVDAGADVNSAGLGGLTPLMLSVTQPDLVKLLLSKGADPNAVAAFRAYTPLLRAAEVGNLEVTRLLLAAGAKVDHANTTGETALHVAAEGNRADVVVALVEGGANVNKANKERETPLYLACGSQCPDAVAALLKARADVEAGAADGTTPLVATAAVGNADIVKALLAAGARADHRDRKGRSALLMAAYYRRGEVARALIAAGADTGLKTVDGKTAWDVALSRGAMDVLHVLKYERPAAPRGG